MKLSYSERLCWTLWLLVFSALPVHGAEHKPYQIFSGAVVVLDPENSFLLDAKNDNYGRLGPFKYSLDGTGLTELEATKFILAKSNSSDRYELLSGNISVRYKIGTDVNLLAQDYGLTISKHFPKIRRLFLRGNKTDNLQTKTKILGVDRRVIKAKLDRVDYNQSVR